MTVVELDCCQHPHPSETTVPRRRGLLVDIGRAVATVVAAGYAVALAGTVLGTAVGIALRESLR